MDLGNCNTFSTLGFSPSPNLISSGFSNNAESECTWTYLTWTYAKPHSQVKVKIHQTWHFVCWIFFFFLLFFSFCFWLYSAKIHSRRWPWPGQCRCFAWVSERCTASRTGSSGSLSTEQNLHHWQELTGPPSQKPWKATETLSLLTLMGKGYTRMMKCKRLKAQIKTCHAPLPVFSEGWTTQRAGRRGGSEFSIPSGPLTDNRVILGLL